MRKMYIKIQHSYGKTEVIAETTEAAMRYDLAKLRVEYPNKTLYASFIR